VASDQFNLLFESRLLEKSQSFEAAGIDTDATVTILLKSKYEEPTKVSAAG